MICAGINTAVGNCGFDPSVCPSVELPGALWCLGRGVFVGVVYGFGAGSVLDLGYLGRLIFLVP